MILIDKEIKAIGDKLISPYDESLVNPSSVDVRIGNKLLLLTITDKKEYKKALRLLRKQDVAYGINTQTLTYLNMLVKWKEIDLSSYSSENPYWLLPNAKILVESLETFYFPDNICGQFRLKSSRGREFYEHLEAGWIDCGWSGSKLTMEIENRNHNCLPIYQGLRMGQIILFKTDTPDRSYKESGRYNNDNSVHISKG
jgi:deoxycytidine triphosphate deaminase